MELQVLLDSLVLYEPALFQGRYEEIYNDIKDKVRGAPLVYGDGETKRKSCIFGTNLYADSAESALFSYGHLPHYSWPENVFKVKEELESRYETKFEFCLAHLYPNGDATIGKHRDTEAMGSLVVSVSFGATRRMNFFYDSLATGARDGKYIRQYILQDGDVLVMNQGTQTHFKHSIPQQKCDDPRINLTFRVNL